LKQSPPKRVHPGKKKKASLKVSKEPGVNQPKIRVERYLKRESGNLDGVGTQKDEHPKLGA